MDALLSQTDAITLAIILILCFVGIGIGTFFGLKKKGKKNKG